MFRQDTQRSIAYAISPNFFAQICSAQIRFVQVHFLTLVTLCLLVLPHFSFGQSQTTAANTVPRLIRYAGVAHDLNGKSLTGTVGITFSLYAEQSGGAALWMETQNVQADAGGHYSVLLGSSKPDGLPAELFASEQARWVGVQVEQQAEQPRVLLVSAPYALKAGDAKTLGGLPASAFLRAPSLAAGGGGGTAGVSLSQAGGSQLSPQALKKVTTNGGTANTIPMFTTATDVENSILTQTGTIELNAAGTAPAASAPIIWLKNNAPIQSGSTGNAIDLRFTPDSGGQAGTPDAYIRAQEGGGGRNATSLQFGTMAQGGSGALERMKITAGGLVGIGTSKPASQLEVDSQSITLGALAAVGASAAQGSNLPGTDGMLARGGDGDPGTGQNGGNGGNGIVAYGGFGAEFGGVAVVANGGWGETDGEGSDGVVATGGIGDGDGSGGAFTGGNFSFFGDGIDVAAGSGVAGFFTGDVTVTGAISAGTKDFKIDHPLDPANKYLVHASVESSEMKNIYDGVITTDGHGEARVQLPNWFEALNTDFRYQLTVIGQFAQAIVARKIQNHEFVIKTNAPNVEVSWQVTGVRQDAFAKAHPLVVEEEKDARVKGFYLHPEFYGAQAEKQIQWARHPHMMKKLQESMQETKAKQAALAAQKQ